MSLKIRKSFSFFFGKKKKIYRENHFACVNGHFHFSRCVCSSSLPVFWFHFDCCCLNYNFSTAISHRKFNDLQPKPAQPEMEIVFGIQRQLLLYRFSLSFLSYFSICFAFRSNFRSVKWFSVFHLMHIYFAGASHFVVCRFVNCLLPFLLFSVFLTGRKMQRRIFPYFSVARNKKMKFRNDFRCWMDGDDDRP